jgi:hypothetical protein
MRLLGVTFLSAFVLFVWGAVTLLTVPWHDAVVLKVQDEAAVLAALAQHAPSGGVFSVPINHMEYTATSPFAMVMYRPRGMGMASGAVMGVSFLTYWFAAIVAALLLQRTAGLTFGGRVLFVIGLGVFTSLVSHVHYWTWMGASTGFTLMAVFDLLVGWGLAGLVLARWGTSAQRTA